MHAMKPCEGIKNMRCQKKNCIIINYVIISVHNNVFIRVPAHTQ